MLEIGVRGRKGRYEGRREEERRRIRERKRMGRRS